MTTLVDELLQAAKDEDYYAERWAPAWSVDTHRARAVRFRARAEHVKRLLNAAYDGRIRELGIGDFESPRDTIEALVGPNI